MRALIKPPFSDVLISRDFEIGDRLNGLRFQEVTFNSNDMKDLSQLSDAEIATYIRSLDSRFVQDSS